MSSTRYAPEDSELRQERWASSSEYNGAISALLAAKRIALVDDEETKAVLWFIQARSLRPGGLKELTKELFAFLPRSVGTPTMRRTCCKPDKVYPADLVRKIRDELPCRLPGCEIPLRGDVVYMWGGPDDGDEKILKDAPDSYSGAVFLEIVRRASVSLPEHLTRLCLDPGIDLTKQEVSRYNDDHAAGVWYFAGLLDGLKKYRQHLAAIAFEGLATTDVSDQMREALDFCYRRRRMILIEGVAGIGKSATVRAWCNRYPGLVRHVEIPASGDDRSFYAAIAEEVGVARGAAYNGQQIKLKVEEALRASGLMLVLDEAQFAWPQQHNRPRGVPVRMQWIKTAFDDGTPIAMVALPEFSTWQRLYVEKTLWRDSQLVRRLNRTVRLSEALSKADFLKIARAVHPAGDEAAWKLLAGCAIALPKKQASAIIEAFISAADIAEQDGRDTVSYEDIEAAIRLDFPAVEEESGCTPAASVQPQCKRSARSISALPVRASTTGSCSLQPGALTG
jgi:histone H3/H4